jgi:hypothetical protein
MLQMNCCRVCRVLLPASVLMTLVDQNVFLLLFLAVLI